MIVAAKKLKHKRIIEKNGAMHVQTNIMYASEKRNWTWFR